MYIHVDMPIYNWLLLGAEPLTERANMKGGYWEGEGGWAVELEL